MKIPKNYDVVNKDVIDPKKGIAYDANPGIEPSTSKISPTPGESATNDTSERSVSKGQPFGKGGSGYSN